MPPCDRRLHAVTMPAAIGTDRFLLVGVASLLHAKAIGTPLTWGLVVFKLFLTWLKSITTTSSFYLAILAPNAEKAMDCKMQPTHVRTTHIVPLCCAYAVQDFTWQWFTPSNMDMDMDTS